MDDDDENYDFRKDNDDGIDKSTNLYVENDDDDDDDNAATTEATTYIRGL